MMTKLSLWKRTTPEAGGRRAGVVPPYEWFCRMMGP